jgi:hypothetical protein
MVFQTLTTEIFSMKRKPQSQLAIALAKMYAKPPPSP